MPVLLAGPAGEPLTVADMKDFLRVTHDAEDSLIALLVTTARQMVESLTGRLLLTQDWRLILDAWPPSGLILPPLGPVASLIAARLRHGDGTETAIAPGTFTLRADRMPPVIGFAAVPAPDRPVGGIELDLRLGYGAGGAQVPADLVQAVRLLAAHLYEHRDMAGTTSLPPDPVRTLLAPYRRVRL